MAAGDLSDALVVQVRIQLEETSAAYYTDAEVFSALTLGQQEIVGSLITMYKQRVAINPEEKLPRILRALVNSTTAATGTQNLPTGFLDYLAIYVTGTYLPIRVRPDGYQKYFEKGNTYLASSSTQPFCSFTSSQIVLETSVEWIMDYIKTPSDMTTDVDPTLDSAAYSALVEYATAYLLMKDSMMQEASYHLERYIQLKNNLYV